MRLIRVEILYEENQSLMSLGFLNEEKQVQWHELKPVGNKVEESDMK